MLQSMGSQRVGHEKAKEKIIERKTAWQKKKKKKKAWLVSPGPPAS